MSDTQSRDEMLRALQQAIRREETPEGGLGSVSTGCAALDALLPGRGFARGTLVEWLACGQASGAGALALLAARQACAAGGGLVVVDRQRTFYPPAAAALGVDLRQLVVVRPADQKDHAWAFDQALRCAGVAAVWAWFERLDGRAFRRLQLAAESSGALGLLLRGEKFREAPSWAETRLLVRPLPRRPAPPGASGPTPLRAWRIEILRSRGAASNHTLDLAYDDETGLVRLVSPGFHAADEPPLRDVL